MDWICNDLLIENAKEDQGNRVVTYLRRFQLLMNEKKGDERCKTEDSYIGWFWNKESTWEQKVYRRLKQWEERHPIMGITICTVMGGILVSLIAGILLEVILMFV